MDLGLGEKVAIVTGAAQGIGREIARAFAREGARVVVNDIDPTRIQEVADEVKNMASEALPVVADVGSSEAVHQMVETVLQTYGRVDILVNNAGIIGRAFVEEMTEAMWDEIMEVNLKGVLRCAKEVIGPMKRQRSGKIVNATSVLADIPDIGMAAYSVSKAGIVTLTRVLAAELAPYHINVNAYAPGTIETPMTRDLITTRGKEKLRYISLARFGTSEDVANLVLFLSSDVSSYITGEVFPITGGNLIVQRPWFSHENSL